MRLPLEILSRIATFASPPVLASFMSTSKSLYEIAGPELYHTIVITRKNASNLLEGMIRSDIPFRKGDIKKASEYTYQPASFFSYSYHSRSPSWRDEYLMAPDDNQVRQEMKGRHRYPTTNFHYSHKLKLLSYCKKIVVESLPPKSFWQDITRLVIGHEIGVSASKPIFKNARTICIESRTVWDLLRWGKLHSSELSNHHFFNRIYQMANIESVCVSLPQVNEDGFDEYLMRMKWNPDLIDMEYNTSRYLRRLSDRVSRLRELVLAIDNQPFSRLKSLAIHGIFLESLMDLKTTRKRISLSGCQCKISQEEVLCFHHFPGSAQLQYIEDHVRRDIEEEMDKLESLDQISTQPFMPPAKIVKRSTEFVLPPSSLINELELGDLNDKIDSFMDDRIKYTAKVSRWDKAEPCVCCGRKEGV